MKTGKFLLLIGILSLSFWIESLGQGKYEFENAFYFDQIGLDKRSMVKQPSTYKAHDLKHVFGFPIDSINSYYVGYMVKSPFSPKSPIMLGIKLNPKLTDFFSSEVGSISKSYTSYIINDSSEATLIALGITTENIRDYKYHVVENDSVELIPWSPIPRLEQNYNASRPYASFGNFRAPGKQLMVEVVNIKNYGIRDGVIFDWRVSYKPTLEQIIVSTPNDFFNITFKKRNRDYASKFDASGIPLDLKFPKDSISSFRLNFKKHLTVPYVIFFKTEINGVTEVKQIEWYFLKDYFDLDSKYFRIPGKYELIIHRVSTEIDYYGQDNTLRIPFEVLPPIIQNTSTKQVIFYGTGALLLFLFVFFMYFLWSKRKIKKTQQQKEKAILQLKAIRSQLNPHFTFNALNSIQNLMNKNDVEAANHYLTRFASLTRRVLTSGDTDLISLADEITLLDDYLQMEQLRFGFTYKINVDTTLNKANIEIPFMLLQPFVENAVKHGVSTLANKGLVEIDVIRNAKNLVLSVSDNGSGFMESNLKPESMGMGLKLSRERIALLNNMNQNQAISLHIVSNNAGSKITIILADWLA